MKPDTERRVAVIAEIISIVSLIIGLVLLIIALTVPAHAQRRPTAVLVNGLFQFQPGFLTPLAPLAAELERQGFRVIIDNHLMTTSQGEEPIVIIGHSAGGASALAFAKQAKSASYQPLVVTLDAAPALPCPVARCLNIHTLAYPKVAGAENIAIGSMPVPLIPHVALAVDRRVWRIVLARTASLAKVARAKYERCDPQIMPTVEGCT